MSVFK